MTLPHLPAPKGSWSGAASIMKNAMSLILTCLIFGKARLIGGRAHAVLLAQRTDVLSPRIIHQVDDATGDWWQLDQRNAAVLQDIAALARQDGAASTWWVTRASVHEKRRYTVCPSR
jgi:hypothetical protein